MKRLTPFAAARSVAGFTMVELMVTVAIVGILAAIAIPAYTAYMVKGDRAAAQAYLLDLAQSEQQYLADTRTYTDSVTLLKVALPDRVATKYSITIALVAGPPPGFTITATPATGSAQVADGPLSLDSAGTKTPSDKW